MVGHACMHACTRSRGALAPHTPAKRGSRHSWYAVDKKWARVGAKGSLGGTWGHLPPTIWAPNLPWPKGGMQPTPRGHPPPWTGLYP